MRLRPPNWVVEKSIVADTFTLEAQPRSVTGKKVGQLRRAGLVPVIVYGPKSEPMALQIPYRALQLALLKAGGTHIISLNIDDGRSQMVLARSVQRDVIKGDILHVDFLAVDASTRITTVVPLVLVGEAPAVKAGLGVLLNGIQSVEIEALPSDLIDRVEVDLSSLKALNDSLHVRDLRLSDRLTVLSDADDMIVRVTLQQEQPEVTEETITSAEPEVVKKGKVDEEDIEG
jgi:large subunit ribosomal protein L25